MGLKFIFNNLTSSKDSNSIETYGPIILHSSLTIFNRKQSSLSVAYATLRSQKLTNAIRNHNLKFSLPHQKIPIRSKVIIRATYSNWNAPHRNAYCASFHVHVLTMATGSSDHARVPKGVYTGTKDANRERIAKYINDMFFYLSN